MARIRGGRHHRDEGARTLPDPFDLDGYTERLYREKPVEEAAVSLERDPEILS